jgi:hypothetical protein
MNKIDDYVDDEAAELNRDEAKCKSIAPKQRKARSIVCSGHSGINVVVRWLRPNF